MFVKKFVGILTICTEKFIQIYPMADLANRLYLLVPEGRLIWQMWPANLATLIGFLLFLPFLVIDLVIASILMALGMMMLSPMIISLPFKLLLFVLVDGWAVMIGSLAATYVM